MEQITRNLIIVISLLTVASIGSGSEVDEQEIPFQWLAASRDTAGVMYPTKKLQSLSPKSAVATPIEIEEEMKVDAKTTRKTQRVYTTSVSGARVLIETVVEEIQKLPGDRIRAVRTTSKRDTNGRLNPAQQEIQEVAPSGTDSFRVTRTLLMPESGGRFIERERVQQTEHRKGDSNVEIERIRYEPDINGKWSASERRISRNSLEGDVARTDEQVYQKNINNRMTLTERVEATEWTDADGQIHRQAESFTPNLDGKLQLSSRTTITQRASEDGRQQTTEVLERANSAEPDGGLRLVHRIVENLQDLNQNETVRQLEVMEPDLNGGWRSLHREKSVEMK